MTALNERVRLSAFACEFGDRERAAESIEGYQEICQQEGIGLSLAAMGCKTFWQMTGPIESYVVKSVNSTLASSGVPADQVDHIIFSTMDKSLRHLDPDFARTVLSETDLTNCVPAFLSMQQCVASLGAVDYARRLFADERVNYVLLVSFNFVPEEWKRIQSFALFGDAVTSCLMSRNTGLTVLSHAVGTDYAGLMGKDNFESRKQVVVTTMKRILDESGTKIEDVEKCFTTNLFRPVAWFNASVAGIHRTQLYIDTLPTRAHCGNCDWMINLHQHQTDAGFPPGKRYLVQSFAPGFFSGAILES